MPYGKRETFDRLSELLSYVADDDGTRTRLLRQISTTLDYLPDHATEADMLRPWLEHCVEDMLDQISRDDFTPAELMVLVGLLGPIFARSLAASTGPTKRRSLRSVG